MLNNRALKKRSQLAWPVVISIFALLAGFAAFFNFPPILRAPLIIGFLLICPGMAYVRLLRLEDIQAEWIIAIALSLAICLVLSLGMVYSGWWQPNWGLLILIVLSLAGAGLQIKRAAS